VTLDVLNSASVRSAIQATVSELGPIDILVNNSGVTSTKARSTAAIW
jgi:NADP-dependent 3-hydroxy acid dehydrogenase YdfG